MALPPVLSLLQLLVSFVSGGLAGSGLTTLYNRSVRRRTLRTDFYPKVSNMYSAYAVRFAETPQGRFWVTVVGQNPKREDAPFVQDRTDFILDLPRFNELKEARKLRQAILDNGMKENRTPGVTLQLDLKPELDALSACMSKLHEKLELDKRLFSKPVSGPMRDVSGTAKDVSEIAKDVTGIRKDIVDTKLAEKNLADPTLEDVLRYDRNLQRFKREWEADKARQANGSDIESWLSTRWVRLITPVFVLMVLFLCLWYIVKTIVLQE